MRICIALVLLLTSTGLAQAEIVYSFDGTLTDHFTPFAPNDNATISQNNGSNKLEYSTPNGVDFDENGTGQELLTFRPRYDQSWQASVDVHLPASYDSSYRTDFPNSTDTWLEVGFGTFFNFEDQFFTDTLVLGRDSSNQVIRQLRAADTSSVDTTSTDARLQIEFDARTKMLTGSSEELNPFSIDIGPGGANWGMASDDTFTITLFGSTGYQSVSAAAPLTLDNFSASLVSVPEPSSGLLAIYVIGLFSISRRVRRGKT